MKPYTRWLWCYTSPSRFWYGPEWEEHCDSAEHYLHNALRAALGGNWAEAIPLAKQAEYEAAQLVHALEAEMRK